MTRNSRELIALSAVALAALQSSCHVSQAAPESPPPGQVWLTRAEVADAGLEVATAGEEVVEDSILTSGVIALDDLRTGHVFSPVTGRVTKIVAQLGQAVKKGDPLATIESPDIGSAVSSVHKAAADRVASEHDLERKRALYAQGAESASRVEASEDAERNAEVELQRARQKELLLGVGNVNTVLQTYTLSAPIDGEILLRNINPGIEVQGQYVGGSGNNCLPGLTTEAVCGELFTVGQLDRVWVLGDLYETDLGRVHVGAAAKVTAVAYPGQVFTGTVDWISGTLDPGTRTAKVRCTLDNPSGKLRPMMYSTVQISVDERKALAIPRSAIVRLGEYDVVFVQVGEANGRLGFEQRPVDVDEGESTSYLPVKHGVDVGQRLVIHGASTLSQRL